MTAGRRLRRSSPSQPPRLRMLRPALQRRAPPPSPAQRGLADGAWGTSKPLVTVGGGSALLSNRGRLCLRRAQKETWARERTPGQRRKGEERPRWDFFSPSTLCTTTVARAASGFPPPTDSHLRPRTVTPYLSGFIPPPRPFFTTLVVFFCGGQGFFSPLDTVIPWSSVRAPAAHRPRSPRTRDTGVYGVLVPTPVRGRPRTA